MRSLHESLSDASFCETSVWTSLCQNLRSAGYPVVSMQKRKQGLNVQWPLRNAWPRVAVNMQAQMPQCIPGEFGLLRPELPRKLQLQTGQAYA